MMYNNNSETNNYVSNIGNLGVSNQNSNQNNQNFSSNN
jgi:hypothetical protein